MSIDLSQFHQVFFEESLEGLDVMESALMDINPDSVDLETINAIFRAAHSIKGGSATFGFSSIAEFTHVLETLLDQVRSGDRNLTGAHIDLLLQSVDCMREMLSLLQSGDPGRTPTADELKGQFQAILDGEAAPAVSTATVQPDAHQGQSDTGKTQRWRIEFIPGEDVLRSGNDPSRIIRELAELGSLTARCHTDRLASLSTMAIDVCYIGWTLHLTTAASKQSIYEVFEWVIDDSTVTIEEDTNSSADDCSNRAWTIRFSPNLDLLSSGNDALRLFEHLNDMGTLQIDTHSDNLPALASMDPTSCYLNWVLTLSGEGITREAIAEVFEWVEDDAKIEITELTAMAEPATQTQQSSDKVSAVEPRSTQQTTQMQTPAKARAAATATVVKKDDNSPRKAKANAEATSIRVGIDKVDNLINMVGELVITQSMLGQLGTDFEPDRLPKLIEGLGQLEQNTRELQESVMRIRMLPISFAFSRFPRMVRDLGKSLGKSVELQMFGEQTELDKTVMEKIGDPLVHLVRNAVDHGLELPGDRVRAGKKETGIITLNAYHQGGNVVIEITDDGKGLDSEMIAKKAVEKGVISEAEVATLSKEQIFDLIFQPGFSTAATVSDVSGRGVGMDVVKRNIQALNGVVDLTSEKGVGSKITIRLPLTLAILDGQLVRVGDNTYIFPLVSIVESMQCKKEFINRVAGGCQVFKLRDDFVPIVELHKVFAVEPDNLDLEKSLLVVVESEGQKFGIVVDELLAQQQVVIKSLEQNYQRVEGVSGATILGDGTVALILDMVGIIKIAGEKFQLNDHSLLSQQHSYRRSMTTRIAS